MELNLVQYTLLQMIVKYSLNTENDGNALRRLVATRYEEVLELHNELLEPAGSFEWNGKMHKASEFNPNL